MSRLDRRSRQSQVLQAVLSVATLCESGIAERALNKQAQKVKYVATDIVAEEPETPSGGNGGNGGDDNNPPGELEG